MARFPRSLLLLALLAVVACAPKTIQSVSVDRALCTFCPLELTIDANGRIEDTTDTRHPMVATDAAKAREWLAMFPREELAKADRSTSRDGTNLFVRFDDGTWTNVTIHDDQHAGKTPRLQTWSDVVLPQALMLADKQRMTDLAAVARQGRARAIELDMNGCYGSCAHYAARFSRDGTATIDAGPTVCHPRIHARAAVPFERLMSGEVAYLRPLYPMRAVDTESAAIVIDTGHAMIRSDGPDSTTWGRPFIVLVSRWDQLVRDTDWTPSIPWDCHRHKRTAV